MYWMGRAWQQNKDKWQRDFMDSLTYGIQAIDWGKRENMKVSKWYKAIKEQIIAMMEYGKRDADDLQIVMSKDIQEDLSDAFTYPPTIYPCCGETKRSTITTFEGIAVKVIDGEGFFTVGLKYKAPKEMTVAEIENELGYPVKIIAED